MAGSTPLDHPARIPGEEPLGMFQAVLRYVMPGMAVQFVGIEALRVIVLVQADSCPGLPGGHGLLPSCDVRMCGMIKKTVQIRAIRVSTGIACQAGGIEKRDENNI